MGLCHAMDSHMKPIAITWVYEIIRSITKILLEKQKKSDKIFCIIKSPTVLDFQRVIPALEIQVDLSSEKQPLKDKKDLNG